MSDDNFERALRAAARAGSHRRAEGPLDGHLSADLIVGHLERKLDSSLRGRVIAHLADCTTCCDKLELAAELLKVDVLPSAILATPADLPVDVGPALMHVSVAVEASSLRVLHSNAEMRVGMGAATRRGAAPAGVAFQRALGDGHTLTLELLEAGAGRLSLSTGIDPVPAGARVSLIERGRLSSTRPLKRGQAIFRSLPLDTLYLRLEAPGRVLGHVRLELADETGAPK